MRLYSAERDCTCICMFVCMYVCMYDLKDVSRYRRNGLYVYMHVCMYVCMHDLNDVTSSAENDCKRMYVYVYLGVRIHVCLYVCVCARARVCMRIFCVMCVRGNAMYGYV